MTRFNKQEVKAMSVFVRSASFAIALGMQFVFAAFVTGG
jgi:hypothetical protein